MRPTALWPPVRLFLGPRSRTAPPGVHLVPEDGPLRLCGKCSLVKEQSCGSLTVGAPSAECPAPPTAGSLGRPPTSKPILPGVQI